MSPPVIETARLRLRGHARGDLDACSAMWADTAVTRYISGRAFSREEVWARLLRYAGHWLWMGYGFWAIEEKESRAFVGEIGIAEFERDMEERIGAPECGWVLAPRFQRRGYAHEALDAVLAWGDARFEATACLIHPENAASLRLAERCGYEHVRRLTYKGQESMILRRLRQ
jgi:RimJ/RimL family protein N-acetyltransferase